MDWKEIDKAVQIIVSDIKDKCIIKNAAMPDDPIFMKEPWYEP